MKVSSARYRHPAMLPCLVASLLALVWCVQGAQVSSAASATLQLPLSRAKIYLAAGDYRRAIEACQIQINQSPSVESYVYLLYVYHALDGYAEWLAQRDEWVKVGQLSLPCSPVAPWILWIRRI